MIPLSEKEQQEANEWREKKRREEPNSPFINNLLDLGSNTTNSEKLESTPIKQLKKEIEQHFPEAWSYVDTALAVINTLRLKDLSDPFGLNFVGAPSSLKTTVLSFFYRLDIIFKTDNFTPKSLVSHCANISEKDLKQIDLLPKIKDKCVIVPELAPLFQKRKDDLVENLSTLTRLFDGEGLETDSGSRGHRGYSGDYLFSWLGATTPLNNSVWKTMGKLGARMFFLNMNPTSKTEKDLDEIMTTQTVYKQKIRVCREAVKKFMNGLDKKYPLYSVDWDGQKDPKECRDFIIKCVELLRRLRAPLEVWEEANSEGSYNFTTPLIEGPERAVSLLYNLARGHAITHGRTQLTEEDLPLVLTVCLSSMPHDRSKFINLLIRNKGVLTTKLTAEGLNCSERQARRVIKTLEILGVANYYLGDYQEGGKVTLKEEFKWILDEKYGLTHSDNSMSEDELLERIVDKVRLLGQDKGLREYDLIEVMKKNFSISMVQTKELVVKAIRTRKLWIDNDVLRLQCEEEVR